MTPRIDGEPLGPLVALRREAVVETLRDAGARRVVDLGCGEGSLLRALLADPAFTEILGVDVSARALELAERRLHLETDARATARPHHARSSRP